MKVKNAAIYKISIIEDSEIHREWLKTELAEYANFQLVSADRFGRDGILHVKEFEPDLVLLDFQLEDITGLEISRRIKSHYPDIKIFALTAHNEISIIERIINDKNIDALGIKGSHYLEDNFITALLHVIEGGTYLDPSLLKNLRDSNNSCRLNTLTKREFEVFIQSHSGKANDKIALDLSIELAHVRNLQSRIAKKLKDDDIDNLISKLVKNSTPDVLNYIEGE